MHLEGEQSRINKLKQLKEELFDSQPRLPEAVCGISTDALMRFANAYYSLKYNFGGSRRSTIDPNKIAAAARLFELLRKAAKQKGKISESDVRPYREAIKKTHLNAGCADIGIGCLSLIFPPLFLLRRQLNKKIEKETAKSMPDILEEIEIRLQQAGTYIAWMQQFDNPRKQYVAEISQLAGRIYDEILAANYRKDGRENLSVTAGYVIHSVLTDMLNLSNADDRYPFLRTIVGMAGVTSEMLPEPDKLGIVAPEIVNALASIAESGPTKDKDYEALRRKLNHSAHPNRGAAEWLVHGKLNALNKSLPVLLEAVRDILPSDSRAFIADFQNLKQEFELE